MKKIYDCNVCRDEMPAPELYGLRFVSNKRFEIRNAASTDGVHICASCLAQLRHGKLPEIPELKAKVVAQISSTVD